MTLALVRDLRELREPSSAEEIEAFETDVLAGFVLARASAGLADSTIRNDTGHLALIRDWFGRPLWEMGHEDADAYFGRVLRDARLSTRAGRAGALTVYFQYLELRHKAEIYNLTGRVAECPLDEMNRPRASADPRLRVPPAEAEIERLFAGWREELATCRKFAPAARNYAGRAAGGRRGHAGQRGPHARPGRRALGTGAVRQAERPPRQGIPQEGAEAAAGAADQRRRPEPVLVHRGCLGPVR